MTFLYISKVVDIRDRKYLQETVGSNMIKSRNHGGPSIIYSTTTHTIKIHYLLDLVVELKEQKVNHIYKGKNEAECNLYKS